MDKYQPQKIEPKWQRVWLKSKIFQPDLDKAQKPFFNLMMFPYPSAEGLHVGNMYAFTGADIYGRFKRMQGFSVFEPIGLDGFGIHSENYALKIGEHPAKLAKKTEKTFYRQLHATGNAYAWENTLETYDPLYYKWTQWIFTKLFKAGLVERKKAVVNWCPSCKTVLADEQVISGKCERCETEVIKKELEQWFFKITKYADRLLKNLDWIDWSERTKIAQRNWIGKSEGAEIKFQIHHSKGIPRSGHSQFSIPTFTTRPDTIFGATFFVLAPESEWVKKVTQSKYQKEVNKYVQQARKKTEVQRVFTERKKTGVFTGCFVINPATNKKIPVWVADYVVIGYGTGAIMGVPAHDERDFDFAKKHNLEIRQVIGYDYDLDSKITSQALDFILEISRKANKENKVVAIDAGFALDIHLGHLTRKHKDVDLHVEKDQLDYWMDYLKERGFKIRRNPDAPEFELYIAENKDLYGFYIDFGCLEEDGYVSKGNTIEKRVKNNSSLLRRKKFQGVWITYINPEKILNYTLSEAKKKGKLLPKFKHNLCMFGLSSFVEQEGRLINSGQFNGLSVKEGIKKITDWLAKKGLAKREVQYRLRDWCISRQRYWGPPIPMIYCQKCAHSTGSGQGWQPVPEKDLPVKLPYLEDWKPLGTGASPLAQAKDWVKTRCPKCGGPAKRETDVSDTFLDSAWYFFRYTSTDKKNVAFDNQRVKKWLPVDMYIGGHEHACLHLMYTRFLTMVFKDLGLISFEEPFKRFYAHGLLISEGAKMSKSKGNIVVPDEYIAKYGADTLRAYLMFLGPFNQGGDFRDSGIAGMWRFLSRVWRLVTQKRRAPRQARGRGNAEERIRHQAIKKVTEDIENLRYNTAISAIMEFVNFLQTTEKASREAIETLVLLLAPFAPHLAEEIWSEVLGNKFSVHNQRWPGYKKELIEEEMATVVIQINGKLRDRIIISHQSSIIKSKIEKMAKESERVKKYLEGKKIKKVVFVPGKLINFVV